LNKQIKQDMSDFTDIDGDSVPELSFYDMTYAYWPYSFVQSPTPRVILRWLNDSYVIAPDLMGSPAPSIQELKKKAVDVKNEWTTNPKIKNTSLVLRDNNTLRHSVTAVDFTLYKFVSEKTLAKKYDCFNLLIINL
jgi:hypothetical protein